MAIKYDLTAIVVLALLVEGLAIYLNIVVHPTRQPNLTVVIIILNVVIIGVLMLLKENKKL